MSPVASALSAGPVIPRDLCVSLRSQGLDVREYAHDPARSPSLTSHEIPRPQPGDIRGGRLSGRLIGALSASLIALSLSSAPSSWASADYSLDDDTWSGIGYLLTTAREAKVEVEVVNELDLDALDPDEVLLWLYPTVEMPVDDLIAFVEDGGHLIVADDFGAAGPLFHAVGIERTATGPVHHHHWYQDEDGFPVLSARGDHFVFFNVDEVVANYPAVLSGEGAPLLSFDGQDSAGEPSDAEIESAAGDDPAPREHLAIERRLGSGALLALGDPSIFVNQMLRRFYGDKQLAANLMRLYCVQEPCALKLLLPTTTTSGRYAPHLGRGPLPRLFRRAARSVNAALADLSELVARPPWVLLIALTILGSLLAVAAVALARWRRPGRGPILDAGVGGETPLVAEAIGLAAAHADADFCALATTLAEHAEQLAVSGHLDAFVDGTLAPPPGETPGSVHRLREALLRVRHDVASLRSHRPPVISAERFVRLYGDVQTLASFGDKEPPTHVSAR